MASRAPCRRDVLETLERALLVRLLAPHAAWLAEHGVALGELAEAPHDADADAPLRALYALLSRRDALASPAGHDALLRAARDRAALLAADRTAASQAAALLLDHPDVFAAARVVASCEGIARYVELAPRMSGAIEPPARVASPESLGAALSAERSPWFAERGRTRYVDVLVLPDDAELMIDITHGDVPREELFARGPRAVWRVIPDACYPARAPACACAHVHDWTHGPARLCPNAERSAPPRRAAGRPSRPAGRAVRRGRRHRGGSSLDGGGA